MKRIIVVLMLVAVGIVSTRAQARTVMQINQDKAADWFIKHYKEYHIHPAFGVGILTGESGAMTAKNNHGRPYGMIGRRYYDVISGTEAFANLIRYSGLYGIAWKYDSWQSQLYAVQSHHYCEGSIDRYVNYIESVVYRYNLIKYDKKLDKYLKKQEEKARRKREKLEKKRKQQGYFTVRYNPTLAPWQVITDADIIKGGTIRIGFNWLDVVKANKDIGQVIETGNRAYISGNNVVKLDEVIENAKG